MTDISKIANCFNKYFANIAEETLKTNNLNKTTASTISNNDTVVESTLTFLDPTTADEMSKAISSLKNTLSAGLDEISARILKVCSSELTTPLLKITNMSMAEGIFPSQLKIAKIYPKFKQGDTRNITNYRPISLLSSISKLIEKLVLNRLLRHIKQNELLTDKQHGFTSGRSTTTAIIDLVEHITDNLEAGNTITNLFLDLSKAFDCLGHKILLGKLKGLGIQDTALKWFDSYLTNRLQVVEMKEVVNGLENIALSKPLPTSRGVPQGSVLGPVLFILFMNDFPGQLAEYSKVIMYADDTVVLTANKNIEQLEINTYIAISTAQDYCLMNDLVLNDKKTKQLTMGSKKALVSEMPNLQEADKIRHLGVTVEETMSWNCHIDNLCLKLGSALFALKRTKATSTPEATRTAYYALFESQLRYGIAVWGSSSDGNLRRVLVMQKRAMRVMADLAPRESCRDMFKNLNILTVTSLYILETILYCVAKEFPKHQNIHEHNTRHAGNYSLPNHKTTMFEKKPSYAGMKMFNKLPDDLKINCPTLMKKRLRRWLLKQAFYTLQDFFSWNDQ